MDRYSNTTLYRSPVQNLGPVRDKKKRSKRHISLLVISKSMQTLGVFICYETLKMVNFMQFLFVIKLGSAVVYTLIHKPVSHGKKLTSKQLKHLAAYSAISALLTFLWMEALVICGPVRTILLWQHSDTAIIAMMNLIFNSESSNTLPSASRGSFFYVIGLFCLLFFDRDKHQGIHHHTEAFSSHVYHHFIDIFSWLGLPDHKGGILLLLLSSVARVFLNNYGKRIALDIDGPKRLKALSSCIETLLLLPFWLLSFFWMGDTVHSIWQHAPEILYILLFVFIVDFYTEAVSVIHLHKYLSYRLGTVVSFCAALVIGVIWEFWREISFEHKISTGVAFATLFFISTTRLLVQPPPIKPRGNLIGYSTSGEPLYSVSTIDGYIPKSIFVKLRQYIRIILEASDSRNIFFYLCLNLAFTGIELLYGMWTNSLGLISDGFHMLFDCSALVLGLWASIASKWGATKTFSFGYARLEVLSGFVNGLFLVVIGFAVFMTAIQRLFDPPTVKTEKLLVVSVAGLLVNLVGITAFSHAHSHGGKACNHGHSHESESHQQNHAHHNHSHEGHGHTHSHGSHNHTHNKEEKSSSANMQGVYLHVLADTMGSVGVILSSLLIEYYQLYIADPICSLFISVLILLSVFPLLKDSSVVLLKRTAKDFEGIISDVLLKIRQIEGVLSYRDAHFWQHTADVNAATLIVQVNNTSNEHKIRQEVIALLKQCGISILTIQVEKQAFHEHMSKLSTGYYSMVSFPENSFLQNDDEMIIRVKDI